MEENSNSKEQQKKAQRLTMIVVIAMTVLILGYSAYGIATKNMNMTLFAVLLGSFVVVYMLMSDVVEPYLLGLFRELTPERRSGFQKMLLMDAIGAAALLYWIVGVGSDSGSDILIPFLIYFLTNQMKRKYRAEFDGTATDEDMEDASGDEDAEEDAEEEEETRES